MQIVAAIKEWWAQFDQNPEPLDLAIAAPHLPLLRYLSEQGGSEFSWVAEKQFGAERWQSAEKLRLVSYSSSGTDADYWCLTHLGKATLSSSKAHTVKLMSRW